MTMGIPWVSRGGGRSPRLIKQIATKNCQNIVTQKISKIGWKNQNFFLTKNGLANTHWELVKTHLKVKNQLKNP